MQCNPYQIPTGVSTELEQIILTFMGNYKGLQAAKALLRTKLEGFKIYYTKL